MTFTLEEEGNGGSQQLKIILPASYQNYPGFDSRQIPYLSEVLPETTDSPSDKTSHEREEAGGDCNQRRQQEQELESINATTNNGILDASLVSDIIVATIPPLESGTKKEKKNDSSVIPGFTPGDQKLREQQDNESKDIIREEEQRQQNLRSLIPCGQNFLENYCKHCDVDCECFSIESSSVSSSYCPRNSFLPCICHSRSSSLPLLNSLPSLLLSPSLRHHQPVSSTDEAETVFVVDDTCILCQPKFSFDITADLCPHYYCPHQNNAIIMEEEDSLLAHDVSNRYGTNPGIYFPANSSSIHERRTNGGVKMRRAMSLSSSYPEARIGRTRKLFCPRHPPTNLQRTLSISRSNLSKRQTRRLSTYQKLILVSLSLVSFTSFLCMSIMAPFFPKVASEKGMSGAVSGFLFSFYALIVMISSPILGHCLPKVGAKFMLISGIFAAGVSSIIFGLLNYLNTTLEFTIYCFIVRGVEAVGAAAFSTASYTYIMYIFPDDIGTAFGLTETCVGVGMSLGPAIGSGLYSLGGYGLPFYSLGGLILLNIPICWFIVQPIDCLESKPPDSNQESHDVVRRNEPPKSYWALITIPQVAAISLVVVIVSQSQGFLDPTVEPHFRQYGLGTGFVGLVFLLMSLAYALLSPITGWIATKMENKYPLMFIGLMLSAFGLILLGPSWFIPLTPDVWISTISMVIMGFAYAVAFIPTFECILDLAIEKGFGDNVKTYSLVSGLWSSMYSLGEVTGPLFGGLFVDIFDFRHGVTIMAGFSFIAVSKSLIRSSRVLNK